MAIKIKATRSYYVTEVSIDLPSDVKDIDVLLRQLRANVKMVVLYSGGGMQGVNVEQRTPIPGPVDDQVREILKLGTKKF